MATTSFVRERERITFRLSDNWNVRELAGLLFVLDELYSLLALPDFLHGWFERLPGRGEILPLDFLPPWILPDFDYAIHQLHTWLREDQVLTVVSIHLESPGTLKIDLGLAEVVKEFRKLMRWVDTGRTMDHLNILKEKMDLLHSMGYSDEVIRNAVWRGEQHVNYLLGLRQRGKLQLEE